MAFNYFQTEIVHFHLLMDLGTCVFTLQESCCFLLRKLKDVVPPVTAILDNSRTPYPTLLVGYTPQPLPPGSTVAIRMTAARQPDTATKLSQC